MTLPVHVRILALAIGIVMTFALIISMIFLSSVDSVANEKRILIETVLTVPGESSTDTPSNTEPSTNSKGSLEFLSNGNGTCSVTGLGTARSASIVIPEYSPTGDLVTAIAPQAFYGEQTITSIHIPASIVHIGNLAFAECKDLSYISVSRENSAYRSLDGVLYTADLSVLILYPPCRAGESLTIHTATTVIREMAFFNCIYLQRIDYTGSPSQWERISIGAKNYSLLAIAKSFGA